jgi:hypothetical protein
MAFDLAEKKIMHDMNEKKENQDNKEVQFRFMQCLEQSEVGTKRKNKVAFDTGGEEEIELMCYD